MNIEITFFGQQLINKYKIEQTHDGNTIIITRITDTTDYSGNRKVSEPLEKKEEIKSIDIPFSDLSRFVISLQKILY